MPRAKVTDSLSETARATLARGFAQGWPAARIVQAVKDETGEAVTERTVSRRAAEWRAEVERRRLARERMQDLVAAAEQGGIEVSGFIRALALEALEQNPEALTSSDPIELHGLALESEKMRLKKREMDIRERAIAIDEKKLAMLEAREQRLVAAVRDDKKELTPEQRLREVRSILGLRDPVEAHAQQAAS